MLRSYELTPGDTAVHNLATLIGENQDCGYLAIQPDGSYTVVIGDSDGKGVTYTYARPFELMRDKNNVHTAEFYVTASSASAKLSVLVFG